MQSPYFAALLGGRFAETDKKEIGLQDDDPQVLQAVIHYLYHFNYDESSRGETPAIVYAVQVYAIAGKYSLPGLKAQACKRFLALCTTVHEDADIIIEAIHAIDENVPEPDRTLWNLLLPAIKQFHMDALLRSDDFQTLMVEMPKVNFALMSLLAGVQNDGGGPPATVRPTGALNGRLEVDDGDEDDESYVPIPTVSIGGPRRLG